MRPPPLQMDVVSPKGSSSNGPAKPPLFDSGSLLKWWFNPGWTLRTDKRKLGDGLPVVVVGSGEHSGGGTTEYVTRGMRKLLFFSYRNCFPPLPNGSTTDTRWGCLVRTTQMLVGTSLLRYNYEGAYDFPETDNAVMKKKISKLFMDLPSAPLGIHKVQEKAHKQGIKYARMLSPSEAGLAMAAALIQYHAEGGDVPFTLFCEGRNVDESAVMERLSAGQRVFLIIPVVLGLAPISPSYKRMMLEMLEMKACCGIAGGFRQASLYVFGRQGSDIFFMDPHYVQTAYISDKTVGALDGTRGVLSASKFDPCMIFGFYLHTPDDFHLFLRKMTAINSIVTFPLISFMSKPDGGIPISDNHILPKEGTRKGATAHVHEAHRQVTNPLSTVERGTESDSVFSLPE